MPCRRVSRRWTEVTVPDSTRPMENLGSPPRQKKSPQSNAFSQGTPFFDSRVSLASVVNLTSNPWEILNRW